jgi:DNA invertase Pin-like site-specific DNA recombinase
MNQPLRRAAQYVRMSTELQQYSTTNQMARIAEYAEANQLTIVRTYLDEGRTGLKIQGRKGLQQLLADVISNQAPFDVILVYDVSRWGRFQDNDESAHYEFLCRRAGKQVVYCAEMFSNDGSPMANIVKGLKRAMASEYSRELSGKVFKGQANLARLGLHVGARSPYGMRRMMINPDGKSRGTMNYGERKSLQSDKVILVPGPPKEIAIVRQIVDWLLTEKIYYQPKIALAR